MKKRLVSNVMDGVFRDGHLPNPFLCYAPAWALADTFKRVIRKWVLEITKVNGKVLSQPHYEIVSEGTVSEFTVRSTLDRLHKVQAVARDDGLIKIVNSTADLESRFLPYWNKVEWAPQIECVFPNDVSADLQKQLAPLIRENYMEQANVRVDQTAGDGVSGD